jgi:hypothetical protein
VASATALIGALASLITALGSVVAVVITLRRTSPRERLDAAEGAARTILDPSTTNQAAITTATEGYLHHHTEHEGQAHD